MLAIEQAPNRIASATIAATLRRHLRDIQRAVQRNAELVATPVGLLRLLDEASFARVRNDNARNLGALLSSARLSAQLDVTQFAGAAAALLSSDYVERMRLVVR